jgi:hypothetical protein
MLKVKVYNILEFFRLPYVSKKEFKGPFVISSLLKESFYFSGKNI